MKPVDRGEVLGLADYEMVRERFRARVVAEKRGRRVALGDKASVLFENRDTVLLQIQEMLRTERITRPAAIQHEIDTYNELLPGDGELSCTLMIEIADAAEREAFLRAANGLERHVWLVAGELRVGARASDRFTGDSPGRTTAVHYLKFPLPTDLAAALRKAPGDPRELPSLHLEVDHPAYLARAPLPAGLVVALGEDQRG
jgi:Protein of unknown function (DUF3501)